VASVALSVTFPLLFVVERRRTLPLIAAAALILHAFVSLGLRSALGVHGLALALGISSVAVLATLLALVAPGTLSRSAIGLVRPTVSVAMLTCLTFGICALLFPSVLAAAVGLALYTFALLAIRPQPLRDALAYVRALQ